MSNTVMTGRMPGSVMCHIFRNLHVDFQPARANVTRIDFARARHEESADVIRVVDFLIKSHLYGAVVPHPIPADMPNDVEKLAMYSFAQYGRRGLYASYADTTSVPVGAAPNGSVNHPYHRHREVLALRDVSSRPT